MSALTADIWPTPGAEAAAEFCAGGAAVAALAPKPAASAAVTIVVMILFMGSPLLDGPTTATGRPARRFIIFSQAWARFPEACLKFAIRAPDNGQARERHPASLLRNAPARAGGGCFVPSARSPAQPMG
jgi:hypothetical protein